MPVKLFFSLLAYCIVLRKDDDAARLPIVFLPGQNRQANPVSAAIGIHQYFVVTFYDGACHRFLACVFPPPRHMRMQAVVIDPDEIGMSVAVFLYPSPAGSHVIHVRIEHSNTDRRVFYKRAQWV